jgi:hypothetical protein
MRPPRASRQTRGNGRAGRPRSFQRSTGAPMETTGVALALIPANQATAGDGAQALRVRVLSVILRP